MIGWDDVPPLAIDGPHEDEDNEEVVEREKKNTFYDLMVRLQEKRKLRDHPLGLVEQE